MLFAAKLIELCDWVQSCGDWGPVVYILVLACAIVGCLPCTIFEIIPGFLFGVRIGFVVCIIGKNLGNAVCVLLAKTVLAGWVKRSLLPRFPNVQILERMVKRKGFMAICIFRGVVYAPLPVKNYGLGSLDIPGSHIVAAAVITGAPYCVWWAYLGSKAKSLVDVIEGRTVEPLLSMPENPFAAAAAVLVALVLVVMALKNGNQAWHEAKMELEQAQVKKSKS